MNYNEEQVRWFSEFCSKKMYKGDPLRGHWNIFVPPEDLFKTWTKLIKLTARGRLGYKISRCSNPMTWGYHQGDFTICCFCEDKDKDKILRVLKKKGFGRFARRYNFIKKFRPENYLMVKEEPQTDGEEEGELEEDEIEGHDDHEMDDESEGAEETEQDEEEMDDEDYNSSQKYWADESLVYFEFIKQVLSVF